MYTHRRQPTIRWKLECFFSFASEWGREVRDANYDKWGKGQRRKIFLHFILFSAPVKFHLSPLRLARALFIIKSLARSKAPTEWMTKRKLFPVDKTFYVVRVAHFLSLSLYTILTAALLTVAVAWVFREQELVSQKLM